MLFEKSTVHFEITSECNHRCIFCYNQHQVFDNSKNKEYISFDFYKQIIDKFVELKVKNVIITGGEPFLHPEILPFIEYAKKRKLDISINTNGSLLTPEINQFLANYKIRLLVSLHGTNSLFEKLVQVKTFDRVRKNLIDARKNYNLNISLQFVPIKINFHHIREVVQFAKELGCYLQVGRYTDPCGISESTSSFGLTIKEYHSLFNEILKIKRELKVPIGLGNGIPFCMIDEENLSNDILNLFNRCGCSLGKSIWALSPEGNIRACPQLSNTIGNILTDSIKILSQKIEDLFNSSVITPEICQDCGIRILCCGGCRASGLVRNGAINSFDPLFPLDEERRNKSIALIKQKIKILGEKENQSLSSEFDEQSILTANRELFRRNLNSYVILRGFGKNGFIYKELNESALAILNEFKHPSSVKSVLIKLSKDFSIGIEEIRGDVFNCIENFLKADILQF